MLSCSFLAVFGEDLTRAIDTVEFAFARECPAEETITTHCYRRADATVEEFITRGRHNFINFRLDGGRVIEAPVYKTDFWEELEKGERVSIDLWRSKIMLVKAKGRSVPTVDNRAYSEENGSVGFYRCIFIFVVLFSICLIYSLYQEKKKANAKLDRAKHDARRRTESRDKTA